MPFESTELMQKILAPNPDVSKLEFNQQVEKSSAWHAIKSLKIGLRIFLHQELNPRYDEPTNELYLTAKKIFEKANNEILRDPDVSKENLPMSEIDEMYKMLQEERSKEPEKCKSSNQELIDSVDMFRELLGKGREYFK